MRRLIPSLLALLSLTLLAVQPVPLVAAQNGEEIQFPIDVYACDVGPGPGEYDPTGAGGPPPDCAPAEGVFASVTGSDGAELGMCTTGADGRCVVPLPMDLVGSEITVTVDESTMPDGYGRMQVNPTTTTVNLEFGVLFAGILTESQPEPPGNGTGEASLTITKLNCPPSGADAAPDLSECVEPAEGIEFALGTPNTGNVQFAVTDADGVVVFSLDPHDLSPEADTVLVGEILSSNSYGELTGYDAGCTNDATGANVPLEFQVGEVAPGGTTYDIRFDFETGDQISCTWFNTYQATAPVPTATTVPDDSEPVEPTEPAELEPDALPAHVRAGSCDDDEAGEIVTDLSGLQAPEGDQVGNEDATAAQISVSSVPVSLDDLLAEEHLIDVHPAGDEDASEIACGEIGGVLDSNGDLTIGLREVDDSGFTGIAFLSPNDDDAEQTDISVFLAEDLAADATPGNDEDNGGE